MALKSKPTKAVCDIGCGRDRFCFQIQHLAKIENKVLLNFYPYPILLEKENSDYGFHNKTKS